jgi:hypothetical protein
MIYSRETSFPVSGIHLCPGLSKPQSLVRLEGLGKLKKNSMILSVLEPVTFRLVA